MSKNDKIKIALGTPAYGGTIDAGHAATWLSLGFALRDLSSVFVPILGPVTPNVQPVCQARNRLLKMALEAGADWLLTIDADVAHEGEDLQGGYDLLQMVLTGGKLGAAIIGAPVLQRTDHGTHMMAYVEDAIGRGDSPLSPAERMALENRGGLGFRPVVADDFGRRGGLPNADRLAFVARVSGSCWAINVDWVRRCMPKAPWFLFAYAEGTLRQLGEDLWFCDEVRKRGGTILCDGRFQPKHRRPGGWMEAAK